MVKAKKSTTTSAPRPLTPKEVLVDLLGGADFDHEILDPEAAADLILDRLRDAGFVIVPGPWPGMHSL